MNKYVFLVLAALATISVPALAETAVENQADINADVGAIHKDNTAIARQHGAMARNRASKKAAKANDDVVQQATDSAKLGVNHAVVGAKQLEKGVDKQILDGDVEDQATVTTK